MRNVQRQAGTRTPHDHRRRSDGGHVFAPYSPYGHLLVPISRTISGYCWTSSNASTRSDAWR